jgi:prepilin-type N-terminal cleavage/methylation domain-containing protein
LFWWLTLRDPKGFTAIEIAVTLVIAGILTSIAVASLGPLLQNRRMREASEQIEQAIRKAQQLARTKDQTTYIRFNPPNQSSTTYTLFEGKPCGAAPSFSNTESLGQNVQIEGTTLDFGTCPNGTSGLNVIAFDNLGRLAQAPGSTANNVGQCIGIDDSTKINTSGYFVCIMTTAGDVSSFFVNNVAAGVPAT